MKNIVKFLILLAISFPVMAGGKHNNPPPVDVSSSGNSGDSLLEGLALAGVIGCVTGKLIVKHWCFIEKTENGLHFVGRQQSPDLGEIR